MFFKRFTFFVLFYTVFGSAFAQRLDATFDLVKFKAAGKQQMVELYCSVNGNSVVFQKLKNGYQASVALDMQFADSAGVKYADKLVLKSPVVADTALFQMPFNLQKRIFLTNGTYKFSGTARDLNSKLPAVSTETELVVNFSDNRVQISDIQLLESYEKSAEKSDYTKNGFRLLSYVSNFYPKGFDKLKFYAEIYNTEAVLGKDKPMVVFYRVIPARDNMSKVTLASQKVVKAAPVSVVLNELDLGVLESGNYELQVEVRDEKNKVLAVQRRFIQRSNPINLTEKLAVQSQDELPAAFTSLLDSTRMDVYLLSLKPIANATEGTFVESVVSSATLKQKQHYLHNFWKKRSVADPAKAWLDYKKRVDFAEKNFANQTFRGFETEMGRVYLQYGPPDKISNERNDINRPVNNTDTKPYQIWQYYNLENQRNRVFVFIQRNLGNPNYNLVHSTANGEISNNEWRKLAERRFNNNSVDRNGREDRSFDREGNELTNPGKIRNPKDH